jgi:hypothetical protein
MLRCDSASFLEFVGMRVSQVKSLSSPEKEWFWIPGDCNLADMGTRPNVELGDLQGGTDYQEGMPWTRSPEEDWPARQEFSNPPPEERRKDVAVVAGALEKTVLVTKCGSLKKLLNIYAYVLRTARKWRVYKRGRAGERQIVSSPGPDETEAAELLLVQKPQEDISMDHIPSLLPETIVVRDKLGFERKIIRVGGRVKAKYRIGYDKDGVPVLPSRCCLSDMYLQQAHEVDHGSVNSMVMRTRSRVWIIQGAKAAQRIKNSCYKCRLLWKPLQKQKMSPLP